MEGEMCRGGEGRDEKERVRMRRRMWREVGLYVGMGGRRKIG